MPSPGSSRLTIPLPAETGTQMPLRKPFDANHNEAVPTLHETGTSELKLGLTRTTGRMFRHRHAISIYSHFADLWTSGDLGSGGGRLRRGRIGGSPLDPLIIAVQWAANRERPRPKRCSCGVRCDPKGTPTPHWIAPSWTLESTKAAVNEGRSQRKRCRIPFGSHRTPQGSIAAPAQQSSAHQPIDEGQQ
jgi:hypothetical protein